MSASEDDRVPGEKHSKPPKQTVTVGAPIPEAKAPNVDAMVVQREELRRQQWTEYRKTLLQMGVGIPPVDPPDGWELHPTVRRTRRIEGDAEWAAYVRSKWSEYRRALSQMGVGVPPVDPPDGWEPQE